LKFSVSSRQASEDHFTCVYAAAGIGIESAAELLTKFPSSRLINFGWIRAGLDRKGVMT
jgi:hypothetical protein